MNERIKELIMESVNFRLDPDSNAYETQVCPEDLEYLVELIVRECVAQCWSVSEMEHKGDVISECSKRMRKHFGVKE